MDFETNNTLIALLIQQKSNEISDLRTEICNCQSKLDNLNFLLTPNSIELLNKKIELNYLLINEYFNQLVKLYHMYNK